MFKSRSIKFKTPPKNAGEHELVKICMAELCKKEGFANCDKLVQRDLTFLCERIDSKTGVLISLSTIKRLFNGQFSRLPQIATLDAIALTAGYKNWQDFKLNKSLPAARDGNPAGVNNRGEAVSRKMTVSTRSLFLAGLAIVIVIGILAIVKPGRSRISNAAKAKFSATKVTGNDIPNTVVFRYNVDSVNADSFFIQQSWDRNKRIRVYKHNYTLTDIYYEPGYHTAKLIANDQIIKTQDVSIPTDRWFFYAKEGVAKGQPEYIYPNEEFKNGLLMLSRDDLEKNKIDIQKENIFISVYFPSRIENSSDNFVLKFRIKVNMLKNESCPFFMSEVFCQRNFMYFVSTLKGCTSGSVAQYGEKYLSGKTNDLSALGSDVTAWQNVAVTVKNKKVDITINGTAALSTTYHQSCGLITGLGFISNGLCAVDFVDLKTIDGKNIYSNNFGPDNQLSFAPADHHVRAKR